MRPALRSLRLDASSLVAVAVGAWATFLVTAVLVAVDPPSRVDHDLQARVAELWTDLTDRAPVLRGTSTVAGRFGWTPVEMTILGAVALVTVLRRQSVVPLLLPLCSYIAVAICVSVLKVTYQRPEPFFWLGRSSRSFPSGHSATTVAVYGGIALAIALTDRAWWPSRRTATVVGMVGLVAVVMLAMLVRSAHWISDIVGGAALATAWLTTFAALLLRLGWLPGHRAPHDADPAIGTAGEGLPQELERSFGDGRQ